MLGLPTQPTSYCWNNLRPKIHTGFYTPTIYA
jgi:hypothetical protein